MKSFYIALACVLSLADADLPACTRKIFASISVQNGTSPLFACDAAAKLRFVPLNASESAMLKRNGPSCKITGATAEGEYVVGASATSAIVVKAINLANPVRNLGGEVIFSDSWQTEELTNADAVADAWAVESSAGADNDCSAAVAVGKLQLGTGCGLVGVPHEARTLNPFRHPLLVTVNDIQAASGAVRIALEVPTAVAMNATGWPHVRHYLPLFSVNYSEVVALEDDDVVETAHLSATISSSGHAQLSRQGVPLLLSSR
jgi:hypothetical protein